MKKRTATVLNLVFIGGPLDGLVERKKLEIVPGELPMYGHRAGNHQYVYQGQTFGGDPDESVVMEFVQIVGRKDDIYG